MSEKILDRAKAQRALHANLSPRYLRLDRLERYVLGTQYDGRPPFWDTDTPVYDRAPCVVYPIVQSAIRSNVDLCLGEGKFPEITSFVDEDDASFDDELGLSEDDSETLDRGVAGIVKQSNLKSVAREMLGIAQACGTAVAIASIRQGRAHVDTTKAKWCTPKFVETRPEEVESLEIKYPYIEEYYNEREKKWAARCMLYRRVIDADSDVTFKPLPADEHGREPEKGDWIRDDTKSVDHGLGFCPVLWYRFLPECSTVEEYDGSAIHAHLLDELDALNMALSQRHVAAMIAASPPTIEIGVERDYDPGPVGMVAQSIWLPAALTDAKNWPADHPANKNWIVGGGVATGPARKRGPGVIWTYENEKAKVEQLTLPGDALAPVDENCRDLRAKIAEALAVVFTDLGNQRTTLDISGRALREQHKRQIERCDIVRDDFGRNCLLPLVNMLLRMLLKVPLERLRVPGAKKILPIVAGFEKAMMTDEGASSTEWSPPDFELMWGDYFDPSEADQKAVVDCTKVALDSGLITKRTAVQRLADFYAIGNVDEYLDALEEESEAKAEKALEQAKNMASIAPPGQPAAKPAFGKPATPPNGAPAPPKATS